MVLGFLNTQHANTLTRYALCEYGNMGHGIWSMGTTTLFLHDPMVSHDPVILHNPMVLHNPLVLHEAFPCTFRPLGGKHISALHWSLMTSNICFWNPDVAVAKRSSARQKCTTSHFTASTSRGLPLPSPLVKTKLRRQNSVFPFPTIPPCVQLLRNTLSPGHQNLPARIHGRHMRLEGIVFCSFRA